MRRIRVQGARGDSMIVVGEKLRNLEGYLPGTDVVIMTDTNVRSLYQDHFPAGEVIEFGTGEEIKTLDTVRKAYERLVAIGADRSSFIVGIGGGVVCDMAGFVASTYLRGVRFGFVPTSLLSQVDASVGGKNGVNLNGFKNMVGVFNQPEFVLCAPEFLRTLPKRELSCGFAEIIKHAAIGNGHLFSRLEVQHEKALALEHPIVEEFVYDSVVLKASIVERDEREKDERRKLNFGHTFGHAIEKCVGMPHGEAVGLGMMVASVLSRRRGRLSERDVNRIESLLRKFELSVSVSLEGGRILEALKMDKKRKGDRIHFVLLHGIGRAVVEEIPLKELKRALEDWQSRGTRDMHRVRGTV